MLVPFWTQGKKKLAIVGAGNAGCITALHYYKWLPSQFFDIVIYHDPTIPMERVGQGTVVTPTELVGRMLDINWYNNPIDATLKTGVLYEDWGKKNDRIFHHFPLDTMGMHFVPQKLSKYVLECGKFTVIEKTINDPEREIDADWIFDCRGRQNRDPDNYEPLINPLNSVLLSQKGERDPNLIYTRCVATPNGWTFVIPNKDSTSYGYLYNNTITSKEDATEDFLERFNLTETNGDLNFESYGAKNVFVGERTILNGNRCFFLEPLEATALDMYHWVAKYAWNNIMEGADASICNLEIKRVMKEVETFVLWHYQTGSKYDSPFWDYAKSLPFNPDDRFKQVLNNGLDENYGNWQPRSFKNWKDNT